MRLICFILYCRDAHIQRQQEALEWKGESLDEAISNAPSSSATQASGNIGFTAKAVVSSSPAVSTQPQAVAAIHSTGAVAPVTVAAKEIANSTPISQKKAVQEKTVQVYILGVTIAPFHPSDQSLSPSIWS